MQYIYVRCQQFLPSSSHYSIEPIDFQTPVQKSHKLEKIIYWKSGPGPNKNPIEPNWCLL